MYVKSVRSSLNIVATFAVLALDNNRWLNSLDEHYATLPFSMLHYATLPLTIMGYAWSVNTASRTLFPLLRFLLGKYLSETKSYFFLFPPIKALLLEFGTSQQPAS